MTKPVANRKTIGDLVEVMAALRTPETGCAWDLEQTFRTIAPYTLEEAFEVADAIERDDHVDLREELGDLLLQVVYHARMAEEAGLFDFSDVTDGITRKMIRRHPHVFGTPQERAAGLQKGSWDRIKADEKVEKAAEKGQADSFASTSPGLLDDVPVGLPALSRALKLQDKAAKVGFDWPSLKPVFDKMREELSELEEVSMDADPRGTKSGSGQPTGAVLSRQQIVEEFGDLLFVMANVARHLKVDPEAALRGANEKFRRRFAHIEKRLADDGRDPSQSDLAEMDGLWEDAKRREREEP